MSRTDIVETEMEMLSPVIIFFDMKHYNRSLQFGQMRLILRRHKDATINRCRPVCQVDGIVLLFL